MQIDSTSDIMVQTGASTPSLLGAASGLGQARSGVELAPQFLREAGFFNLSAVRDLGDIGAGFQLKPNAVAAWAIIQNLQRQATSAMRRNSPLLTIGGDHSVAAGTISSTLALNPQARVVWIDAHGDMNTPESSPTGNLHGMPLAALLGLFESPLTTPRLQPENLLMIGVRDLDPGEIRFIADLNIEVVTARELHVDFVNSMLRIERWLKRSNQNVHLSFDVDSLDPSVGAATGIHVPGGLSLFEAREIFKIVQAQSFISAVDVVELNPLAAPANEVEQTLTNLHAILSEISFLREILSVRKDRRASTEKKTSLLQAETL